jgi:hypothetical protein
MIKKLLALCIFAITISANAQVIKQGGGNQSTQDDLYYGSPYGGRQKYRDEKPFEFKKRSLIQINLAQFAFTNVALSYEIFSKDGKSSVKIPFTFGIGGEPDTAAYQVHNEGRFLAAKNRIFETGLHYNYYFFGQKRVSPFMGAGFNVGAFNYWEYKYTTLYNNGYSYYSAPTISKNIGTNVAGALFAGVLFNPAETVTFGLKAGMGFRRYGTDYKEYTYPYGILEINLGFKF